MSNLLLALTLAVSTPVLEPPTKAEIKLCKQAARRKFWRRQLYDLAAVVATTETTTTSYRLSTGEGNYSGVLNTSSPTDWQQAIAYSNLGRSEAERKYQAETSTLNCKGTKK